MGEAGWTALPAAAGLCGAVVVAWSLHHATITMVLTDTTLALAVIGVANLWAQGGLRAGHVAAFAITAADDHVGAFSCEGSGDGASDVAGGTGDERGLP